jgi:hypothetical protein
MSACRHLSTAKRWRRPAARQSRDTDSPARSSAYAASLRDTNSLQGRIKREVEVVHLVANHLTDLSAELATVGERDAGFPLPHGRGDELHHGSPGIDPRSLPPKGPKPRDIYVPDLHIDSIKVKTRDFK